MHTINQLTIGNCAIALIDHQPFVAFPVRSITPEELTNNVTALAKVAQALEVPTILTTINAQGGPLDDPLFLQLQRLFPTVTPIDRHNTNAWSDPAFVAAVKATGRQKLVMCGLWTEVCLAQTVLSALKDGYEVYFVSDCSGGVSREAHDDAKARMVQAGGASPDLASGDGRAVPRQHGTRVSAALRGRRRARCGRGLRGAVYYGADKASGLDRNTPMAPQTITTLRTLHVVLVDELLGY